MQRHWAVHVVREARGSFYRTKEENAFEAIEVNDLWSKKVWVTFDNDYEAMSSANVLEYLPELTSIEFDLKVTDNGIKSILASR